MEQRQDQNPTSHLLTRASFPSSFANHFRKLQIPLDRAIRHMQWRIGKSIPSSRDTTLKSKDGYEITINKDDHPWLKPLKNVESYEPEVHQFLRKHIRPGMSVADVGANVGIFTVFIAKLVGTEGRVYAFEPDDRNLRCLEKNVWKLGLQQVVIESDAVSYRNGNASFGIHASTAKSALHLCDPTRQIPFKKFVQVQTITLDDYFFSADKTIRVPSFIKIDVEDAEAQVLQGASWLMRRHRPKWLIELHSKVSMSASIAALTAAGYEIKKLKTSRGASEVATSSPNEIIFAKPKEEMLLDAACSIPHD